MKFPPSLLDDIRARLPVSAVVGRRVRLKKQGREWRGLSPFNAEKTPSFYVNDQKGFYHCFSSGRHGDIFKFLMETEGLPFPEAVARLAGEAGVAMPEITQDDVAREETRATLYDVLELAAVYFERNLHAREGANARGYLADRGLTPSIQAEFRLGYASGERFALRDHLAGKGVDRDTMIETGLLVHGEGIEVPYDRFRNRVMFPIADTKGRVIAFGGRAMDKDAAAKYLNSPETTLFHKGSTLYNIHKARAAAHQKGTVIAVEGYVDVIMMSVAGFTNTVAPLGTALTEDQIGLLWRMGEEPILCFDGDKAGRRAAYRAIDLALPLVGPGKSLKFALLPDGKDPDDLVRSSGPQAVEEALKAAQPMVDVLWTRETEGGDFATPERRAALERRISEALAPITDEVLKKHYRANMAERLKVFFGGARSGPDVPLGKAGARGWSRNGRGAVAGPSLAGSAVKEGALVRGGRGAISTREALILAAVIGHPHLLERHCESLAGLEFDNLEADRLRGALVDAAALGLVHAGDLADHLTQGGFAPVVERLMASTRPQHWWIGPEAAAPDVEVGFQHVVTLHRKMRTLNKELQLAQAVLERDLTDDNFARLADIKAQIADVQGAEASIEGFGASSGRVTRSM